MMIMLMTQPICGTKVALPPSPMPDTRWAVLVDLVKCRKAFGLNDRDLTVLRGLISCLPKADQGKTFVFASNITLSNRTDGMQERTLRRHLAKLIAAGLITRHSSPNGKRYVRRNTMGDASHAFGFDLAPLFAHHAEITARATAATAHADQMAVLREELSLLRNSILPFDPKLAETVRKALRRNLAADHFLTLIDEVKTRMTANDIPVEPQGMSGNDGQIVRHKQKSIKDLDKNRNCLETKAPPAQSVEPSGQQGSEPLPNLNTILEACPESCAFTAQPLRTWQELIRFVDIMAPMLQIDHTAMIAARQSMGAAAVAVAVMCILQMGEQVRSAEAYLRGLSKRAAMGRFSCEALIKFVLAQQELARG